MAVPPNPIRLLVVDDHPVVRQGIEAFVSTQPDMCLIAEAATGGEAMQQFRTHRPDVTLMDLQMPEMNGIDVIITLRDEFPEARIIVLTTYSGDAQVIRALKAGARGYLIKDAMHRELLQAIRLVYAGKKFLSAEASSQLAEHSTEEAITTAELRVLRLIANGDANKEIAAKLSVSEDTVKGQVRNILAKLRAKDRTHAAMIGLKRGMIDL